MTLSLLFDEMRALMIPTAPDTWEALCEDIRDFAASALAFRMVSAAAGSCATLQHFPNEAFPYRLFCMMDTFEDFEEAREDIKKYVTLRFVGPALKIRETIRPHNRCILASGRHG